MYIQPHAIGNMEEVISMRNDSYVYGAHPFYNVEAVDFAAFPETYAEMLAQVDSTNWAVVNNRIRPIVCICAQNPTASRYHWASSTTERRSMWTKSAANGRTLPSGATCQGG